MFQKSETSSNPDLFNSFVQNLKGARLNQFNDEFSWHNVFREHVTWMIDEKEFDVLFSEGMGRPNSPIRILVAMMLLKEGNGWSDEKLFEYCNFNILVMSSLGLSNLDDNIPSPATYYNLKKSLYEYQLKTGEDIVGKVFQKLTKEQSKTYGVDGINSRMDSVLIGSNIAKCSRLQLIINVLQEIYKDIKNSIKIGRLQEEDRELLEKMSRQKSGPIIYKLTTKGREELLERLGYLLYRIQNEFNEADSNKYHLVTRVLVEQYQIEGDKVELKAIKDLSAKSLQSTQDEEAEYRNKNGEKVRGYSANITETSNEEGLNLITDIQVKGATTADNEFVIPAIENSLKIISEIKQLNTDGAFHSIDNQDFVNAEEMDWILSGISGREGAYEFQIEEEKVTQITNKQTGEVFIPKTTKSGRYRILINGTPRYFSKEEIISYLLRLKVQSTDQRLKNMRNNVEATVFQLVWLLRNRKTRYRGKYKNQLWAYLRCMWINLVRIKNYMGELRPKNEKSPIQHGLSTVFQWLSTILTFILTIKSILYKNLQNMFFRKVVYKYS